MTKIYQKCSFLFIPFHHARNEKQKCLSVLGVEMFWLIFLSTCWLNNSGLTFDHKHKHLAAICLSVEVFMQLKWVFI